MDDDEDVFYKIEAAVEGVESAVERVERAVESVEKAVKDKWTTPGLIAIFFVGFGLWSLPGDIWHSKWRYAVTHGIPYSQVYAQDEPHDCAFFAAPLGNKYCHYERTVSITRWATSQTGNPIISYDDGETWSPFDAGGKYVPKFSTVKAVYISWEKKDD